MKRIISVLPIFLILIIALTGCRKERSNPTPVESSSIEVTPTPTESHSNESLPTPTELPSPKSEASPTPTESPTSLTLPDSIKDAVVYIKGVSLGSGIIISHKPENNTYYVLTARHVVGIPPGIEDPYKITLSDGQTYSLKYNSQIIKDEALDLAIVKFESKNNYPVAPISENIAVDQPVLIFGWKNCLDSPKTELTTGKIEQKLTDFDQMSESDKEIVKNPQEDYKEGYTLKYTNPTIGGMSGSPVVNASGEVIAIHGKPGAYRDTKYHETCIPLSNTYGLNWGITITDFLNSSLSKKVPLHYKNTSN